MPCRALPEQAGSQAGVAASCCMPCARAPLHMNDVDNGPHPLSVPFFLPFLSFLAGTCGHADGLQPAGRGGCGGGSSQHQRHVRRPPLPPCTGGGDNPRGCRERPSALAPNGPGSVAPACPSRPAPADFARQLLGRGCPALLQPPLPPASPTHDSQLCNCAAKLSLIPLTPPVLPLFCV
jgi:hypothetical protein